MRIRFRIGFFLGKCKKPRHFVVLFLRCWRVKFFKTRKSLILFDVGLPGIGKHEPARSGPRQEDLKGRWFSVSLTNPNQGISFATAASGVSRR